MLIKINDVTADRDTVLQCVHGIRLSITFSSP